MYILLLILMPLAGICQSQPVKETSQTRISKVYPNPAANYINFEFKSKIPTEDYSLVIYSFIGKKVADIKINSYKMVVPLKDYYRGVYIFQIFDKEGRIAESGKFQVVN